MSVHVGKPSDKDVRGWFSCKTKEGNAVKSDLSTQCQTENSYNQKNWNWKIRLMQVRNRSHKNARDGSGL